MKIEPKSSPHVVAPTTAKPAGPSSRDRAVAKFIEGTQAASNTQTTPVRNPNQISPEEMSAIRPNTSESQSNPSQGEQKIISEGKTETTSEDSKVSQASTPQSDKLSPQYAMLAKKERALRAEIQKVKAREDAIKAKEQEYQSNFIPKERFSTDPLGVLTEHGVTYEQLTSLLLNQGNPEQAAQSAAVQKLETQVQALRDAQEADRKSYTDQQTNAYNQALNQIRSEVKHLVKVDPYFEAVRETKSINDVVNLIERTYNEDGVLLSVEDAAREVEDYLIEKAERLSKLGKIQSKLQPTKSATPDQSKQTQGNQSNQQTQTKTLTNSMSSSRQLSARERAILAFKGELNK